MKIQRSLRVLAATTALVLVAAACGDDDAEDTVPDPDPPVEEPTDEPTDEPTEPTEPADEPADIVTTAVDAGFSTLATAVTEAGLVETLQGPGPFTVFAPTDEAFAALPEGTLESLLEDPEGALTEVLTYHVVAGEVFAADLEDGQEVETLNGATLTVSIDGDMVMIGDATVVTADVEASNGVIHVIDTVLVP